MDWDDIRAIHHERFNRSYVACHEPAERQFICELILRHYPAVKKSDLNTVIKQACKELVSPRSAELFFMFLQSRMTAILTAANSVTQKTAQ